MYQVVGVCTMILSFFSALGACYIIYTAYQKRKDKQNRDFIVNDYVYYMSWCDLCGAIQVLLYWSAVGFDSSWMAQWPFGLCWVSAFIFQFVLVSSATWNFFIAINLVRLMAFKASPMDLKYESDIECIAGRKLKWNHVIVWGISLIATLVPVTSYGYTPNAEEAYGFDEYECWIEHKDYQLCLYAFIFVYVGLTICILFWIVLGKFDIVGSSTAGTQPIQNRLAAYSLLFVIVWIFPLIARSYKFAGWVTPPWLVVMHHLLLASVGIGNCLIWSCLPTEFISKEDDSSDEEDEEAEEAGRRKKITMTSVDKEDKPRTSSMPQVNKVESVPTNESGQTTN
eukprot:540583_1